MLKLNQYNIIEMKLTLPKNENWRCSLVIDTTDTIDPSVKIIDTLNSNISYSGTIVNQVLFRDKVKVVMVGGQGNLRKELNPKFYDNIQLKTVLNDILLNNETLSGDSQLNAFNTSSSYLRTDGSVNNCLNVLLNSLNRDLNWVMNSAGQIQIYTGELSNSNATRFDVISVEKDSFDIIPENISIKGGDQIVFPPPFENNIVNCITYYLTDKKLRGTIYV